MSLTLILSVITLWNEAETTKDFALDIQRMSRLVSNQFLNHKGKQVSTRRQTNTRPKSYERSSVFKILSTPFVLYRCRDFASWFNGLRPNKHLCSAVYVMTYYDITINKNAALMKHATPFPFCLTSVFTPFLFCNIWLIFLKSKECRKTVFTFFFLAAKGGQFSNEYNLVQFHLFFLKFKTSDTFLLPLIHLFITSLISCPKFGRVRGPEIFWQFFSITYRFNYSQLSHWPSCTYFCYFCSCLFLWSSFNAIQVKIEQVEHWCFLR